MSSVLGDPGDHQTRRLVLRPLQPEGPDDEADRSVASEESGERDQDWALTDPWGSDEGSAAARVVTRRVGEVVMLRRISVSEGAPVGTIRALVQQLVAVLRRTDASMVVCSWVEHAAVREELLAAGFLPMPGELGAEPARVILQL